MIQGTASSSNQNSYGFENLVRAGAQTSSRQGTGSRAESRAKEGSSGTAELTPEQQRQVEELKKRDREVRQHEQTHLAVGRDLVRGGPTYSYVTGPDNKQYAVSGEVSIDSTPGRTPEETIPKAQHIRETALAPAEPSAQDRNVAAKAGRMEADARIEQSIQQQENARNEAANDTGNARLYGGVQQSEGSGQRIGGRLDLFA